jgi:hypothetical protein
MPADADKDTKSSNPSNRGLGALATRASHLFSHISPRPTRISAKATRLPQ